MAIGYFGIASTPTNGNSNSTSPTVVTPPSSMTAGQLVVVVCSNRLKSDTHAVSQAGGQTWTKLSTKTSTTYYSSTTWFYCVFNGTWSASPSFSHGGTNNTCIMLVFTPTAGSSWLVDVAESPANFAAPSTPYDVTITGITCAANSVTIASWFSQDDNTWAYQAGTSWTQPATATVNNLDGNDSGMLMAYRLMPSGGSSGSPVGRETTNQADGGAINIMSFKEVVIHAVTNTETASGTDTNTSIFTGRSAKVEALTGTDNPSAVYTGLSVISEAGTGSDTPSGQSLLLSAIAESTTAGEASTGGLLSTSEITEAGAGLDNSSSSLVLPVDITESASSEEESSSSFIGLSAIAETGTSEELTDGVRILGVAISEESNASDTQGNSVIAVADIEETGNASDLTSSVAILSSAITEGATLAEIITAMAILNTAITEPLTGLETSDSLIVTAGIVDASIEEALSALDLNTAARICSSSITETTSVADGGGYSRSRIVNQ